jgi:hypothetical protein
VIHRSESWPEVRYVTNTGSSKGRVIAFVAPNQIPGRRPLTFILPMVTNGMTTREMTFAHFKLQQPEKGPERAGRLLITGATK